MKYAEWNQILIDYYFNESRENEAFLGIEKESFIDYLVDKDIFSEEYYAVLSKNPTYNRDIRTYIWNNFIQLFKKREYYSKDTLFCLFDTYLYNSRNSSLTPMIFPFIALFLMPLANNPEMNASNFYDRLTAFLKENYIIKDNESIGTPDMSQIKNPTLDLMWKNLESWAQTEGYNYHLKNGGSSHKYVGPFMAESLLNANQRDRFKVVFYEAGLTQDLTIDDARIIKILNLHHRHLGFTDNEKWKTILKNYKDVLISEFRRQYYKWDGNTIVRTHRNNRRVNVDTGTNKKLYLGMDIFRSNYSFYLKARFNEVEPGTDYLYQNTGNRYEFRIANDGFANEKFICDNLEQLIISNKGIELCDSKNKKNRLSFQNEEIYLLEKYYQTYTSSCQLKIGGKFYVLVSRTSQAPIKDWLEANRARRIDFRNRINEHYDLYYIDEVKSSLPTVRILDCDVKVSAKLVNTYHFNKDNIDYIYQGLPAHFDIQGVNVSHDNVRALIDDGVRRTEISLNYNEDTRLWVMPPVSNKFLLAGKFTLYCNDQIISSKIYGFTDFPSLDNEEYNEICYNKWGEYTEEIGAVIQGMKVNIVNGLAPFLKINMDKFGRRPLISDTQYEYKDFLLYYLSAMPRISKADFIEAVKVQVHNNITNEYSLSRWSIRSLIDNYFRLGYINYAYYSNQHIIAINKPTLVLIPSKVNRTVNENQLATVKGNNCKEKYFKAMLTGARSPKFIEQLINNVNGFDNEGKRILLQIDEQKNPLYPQRITLWCEDELTIKKFADRYGINFQVSIYANSLLNCIGSVKNYEKYIYEKYDDFSETYEGFSDYSVLNFRYMADCAEEKGRINFNNIYRDEFDPDGDIVTYFPGKYSEKSILWKDGKQYPVDKYWGQFIGMNMQESRVIEIDRENNTIKIPKYIRLPFLFARALTLMTGEIPEITNDRRAYELCDNPFAQAIAPEAIIEKLGQN